MKRSNKSTRSQLGLLATAILFASSLGCSLVFPAKIRLEIPARPQLESCPAKPAISGTVQDGKVVMALADAIALRDWISAYQICTESNQARTLGHIEKLENRLKAIGG